MTRVYSTVVAYKEEENEPGEYVPVATYQEAPTDLGCGWSLDFPWLELQDGQPGKYMHLPKGVQVKTNFQNGVWVNETYGFTMYQQADLTYVRYRDNGIQEEFDTEGRIISITDLNGNVPTFTYANDLLHSITDTVGRVLTFTYASDKLNNWDIYGYNLSTKEEFQITDNLHTRWHPAIYGDIVVWHDVRNFRGDIYGYNLSTGEEFQITKEPHSQRFPAIYGDIVVWKDHRNHDSNHNWDIYGYNLSTGEEFPIAVNRGDRVHPRVYENNKELEMGRIRNKTEDTPLAKYGVK